MIRSFRHKGLQRFYLEGQASGIRPEHAKRLRLILGQLDASCRVADMDLPGLRLHSLKGRQKGFLAVNVNGNWRVVFRFEGQEAFDVDYIDYH